MDISCNPYICKDDDGNMLISIESEDETLLYKNPFLTHCLAVVKIGNDYLFRWNNWRNRYEIFGGCIECGESPRECILRECYEELGINNADVVFIGTMKFLMQPDYFSSKERIEYGGLYGITLPYVDIDDMYIQIKDKNEITKLTLYSQIKNKEPIAIIDEKLLNYFI